MIEHTAKWPLRIVPRLKTWTTLSAKLLLIGDAAHSMPQFFAQGAAMAVEDAAALAVVLSNISSSDELTLAVKVFESERLQRTGQMFEATLINGVFMHMPDGPEQEARDKAMRAEVEGRPFLSSANQWSDPVTVAWSFGYDAEEAMEDAWEKAVNHSIEGPTPDDSLKDRREVLRPN